MLNWPNQNECLFQIFEEFSRIEPDPEGEINIESTEEDIEQEVQNIEQEVQDIEQEVQDIEQEVQEIEYDAVDMLPPFCKKSIGDFLT